MLNLPVLLSVDVDNYELYPGSEARSGLHLTFESPATILLGANGLGKSTLIGMMYRSLAGPFDISRIDELENLGNLNLKPVELTPYRKRDFARRTGDGAKTATIQVEFQLGPSAMRVERRLSDFSLVGLLVGSDVVESPTEKLYQQIIEERAGVGSYSDWLLTLRFITFYSDERRPLLWDQSAQRQLLRPLFLSPADANRWTLLERRALEADSAFRNLRAVVNREEKAALQDISQPSRQDVASQLFAVAEELAALGEERNSAALDLDQMKQELAEHTLISLRLEQEVDSSRRAFERDRLASLLQLFPSSEETAAYIYSTMFASGFCIACGTPSEEAPKPLPSTCLICGSVVEQRGPTSAAEYEKAQSAERALDILEAQLDQQSRVTANAQSTVRDLESKLSRLEATIARAENKERALRKLLPPERQGEIREATELSSLRARLKVREKAFDSAALELQSYLEAKREQIFELADSLERNFQNFASAFLVDAARLDRELISERIGQSSDRVEYPAYSVELSDAKDGLLRPRQSASEVSESQKEFIDLAFRMALIATASNAGRGSIIIDTPESSLDRVFARRAAHVLSDYALSGPGRSIFICSNMTESGLIPGIIRRVASRQEVPEVWDLRSFARPTAATAANRAEYDEAIIAMADGYIQQWT